TIKAFAPAGMEESQSLFQNVEFCEGPYDALKDAHVVALITEWDIFRALDLDRMKTLMAAPVMVDLRNVYAPSVMVKNGFTYASIGR
ncbi:MAG: UDP binding domain-containing protein, partial [Pseudomonadota bacterium]